MIYNNISFGTLLQKYKIIKIKIKIKRKKENNSYIIYLNSNKINNKYQIFQNLNLKIKCSLPF